ncbi:MAG: RdgB/HAM1 family non-canonical purine NTP pyrophosphatase [Clostridia bacterium]|nr:RdgB/HAM1 family non-canonical purine NTP pyrophosphatase [Clostridia bacterium]
MKIVLASRNKHKIEEWQATLRKYIDGVEILSLDEVGIFGEIEENGETFEDNALIKAMAAAKSGYLSIGEDSGLSVNALGGEPGVYSARYAGEHGNDRANNELLLSKLKDESDRSAKFVCTIALVDPANTERYCFFRGETEGTIIDEYRGDGGFGYDPIFYYEPLGKTFAELSGAEKNAVSHRGKAIELFAKELAKIKTTE